MKTLVALDLETTGLDPQKDAIIEIGAVRFRGERIEDRFSALVNPGRPLGAFITGLTGITDDMLAGQPPLERVLPRLQDFVGDLPVLGHNVRFDLGFLQVRGALRYNENLDTFDLASVLLTSAPRYNLGALGLELGIPLPATHRALDDALVTRAVFNRLFERTCQLPLDVLAEIVRHGRKVDWGGGWIFQEALARRSHQPVEPRRGGDGPLFSVGRPAGRGLRAISPDGQPHPLDTAALAGLLAPGGPLSLRFPGYEHRAQQIEMLRAVAGAFNQSQHMLIEAGTGTGKSLAYLIPAIEWARHNGRRVLVSTNTINLQEQLLHKDIPALREVLGLDFEAALLKGRSNYLCPRRLASLRHRGPASPEEMRLLAKVLVWLDAAAAHGPLTGDRSELTLTGPGTASAWARISAEDDHCTAETCIEREGGACPFYQARRAAEAAHVLIINHALLMADMAAGNQVLPEYDYLVVDEAHHLEGAATEGLSFEADQSEVDRRLRELGDSAGGLLGNVVSAARGAFPPDRCGQVQRQAELASLDAGAALSGTRSFFDAVEAFLADQRRGQPVSEYGQQVRVMPATRNLPYWEEIEIVWEDLRVALQALAGGLGRLNQALAGNDGRADDLPDREDLSSSLTSAARYFEELVASLDGLVVKPDPATVYWCEARAGGGRVILHAAPLHVGSLLEEHLWNAKDSVVLTSATLTVAHEFDYLKGRLNAREAGELPVGSPFDYRTSTLLYLVSDIPEPSDRHGFQRALDAALIPLCAATRGRALVLFTSYAQLRQTEAAISDPLARAGVTVYAQNSGTSRSKLLGDFKSADRAVLLGTRSFWEGVDVPGEDLSLLVIVKLPFDVPSDPIIAARAETFEHPFNEYSVPEAVLRFRQGFGRLIRTRTDRGVVAVFDKRIINRQYGRQFIDSLPECTRRQGPRAALPEIARRWIDEGRV